MRKYSINLKNWLKKLCYEKTEVDEKLSGKSDINHRHDNATTSNDGFLSKEDKSKIDSLSSNPEIDSQLSETSENPVMNKAIYDALSKKMNVDDTVTPEGVTIDSEIKDSANPVQNQAIKNALSKKADISSLSRYLSLSHKGDINLNKNGCTGTFHYQIFNDNIVLWYAEKCNNSQGKTGQHVIASERDAWLAKAGGNSQYMMTPYHNAIGTGGVSISPNGEVRLTHYQGNRGTIYTTGVFFIDIY